MSKLRNWFKPTYKIVPTYGQDNKVNGYMPMRKAFMGYIKMPMMRLDNNGNLTEVDAWFSDYQEAVDFLIYVTKTITNEEIFSTENNGSTANAEG